MNKCVTIVIPVYNAEKYIKSCIKSVLHQTSDCWKIILIDDGSKDKSGEICDYYSNKFDVIKVIHQENSGTINARKRGIEESDTEFITFVDADDTLAADYIEYLLYLQRKEGADIVCAKSSTISKHGLLKSDFLKIKDNKIELFDGREYSHKIAGSVASVSLWAKLYKKSLFEESNQELLTIPDVFYGEDSMINAVVFSRANVIVSSNRIIYHYRIGGFSSRSTSSTTKELAALYQWRNHFLIDQNAEDKYRKFNLCHVLNVMLYYAHYSKGTVERKKVLQNLSEPIADIPFLMPSYKYRYAYDADNCISNKEFCNVYHEKASVILKQFIMRLL